MDPAGLSSSAISRSIEADRLGEIIVPTLVTAGAHDILPLPLAETIQRGDMPPSLYDSQEPSHQSIGERLSRSSRLVFHVFHAPGSWFSPWSILTGRRMLASDGGSTEMALAVAIPGS